MNVTKRGFSYFLVAVVMFVAGMVFVSAGGSLFGVARGISAESMALPGTKQVAPVTSSPLAFEEAFLRVSEAVNPAVVQISSSKRVPQPSADFFGSNPLFEEFFGRRRGDGGENEDRYQLQQGLGSGAIIHPDGYIVTNRHVINNAEELEVKLFDGRQFSAKVIGSDELSDIAVIQIDVDEELPFLDSGTRQDLRVGQWVLAFGSPLSATLSNTVTAGIVSALGRFSQENRIENFIQTDAAINPGNSGGPLLNLSGELVGINTAIYTRTGGYQGIGLAIPVKTVDSVVEQLIRQGRVSRGYLGIRFSAISESLSRALDAPRGAAQVASVEAGGAADAAGIEQGDVIVAINGKELTNANELLSVVATSGPGDQLEIEYIRDDGRHTTTVELGERREDLAAAAPEPEEPESHGVLEDIQNQLGVEMLTLDSEIADRYGFEKDLRGVVLVDVDQTSEAYRDADIRPRDVIVEADRREVESVGGFIAIYREVERGDTFLVRVNRRGNTFLTALTKPE